MSSLSRQRGLHYISHGWEISRATNLARNVLISTFFRGSKSIKNRYKFCTVPLVDLEEEIIDKDLTQSYWLALQFWVQPNRIFTVGVPQASHGIREEKHDNLSVPKSKHAIIIFKCFLSCDLTA